MPVSVCSQIINYLVKVLGTETTWPETGSEAQWGFEKCASSFQNLPTTLSLPRVSRGHFITPFESN